MAKVDIKFTIDPGDSDFSDLWGLVTAVDPDAQINTVKPLSIPPTRRRPWSTSSRENMRHVALALVANGVRKACAAKVRAAKETLIQEGQAHRLLTIRDLAS